MSYQTRLHLAWCGHKEPTCHARRPAGNASLCSRAMADRDAQKKSWQRKQTVWHARTGLASARAPTSGASRSDPRRSSPAAQAFGGRRGRQTKLSPPDRAASHDAIVTSSALRKKSHSYSKRTHSPRGCGAAWLLGREVGEWHGREGGVVPPGVRARL